MTSLESYLRNEYQSDKQQLERTHRVIQSVIPIFYERFTVKSKGVRTWPYRLDKGVPQPLKKFSDSTHSMILFALDAILRGVDRSRRMSGLTPILFPRKIRVPKLNLEGVSDVVRQAKRGIVRLLMKRASPLVSSKTFGQNDPMTLTWLAELLLHCPTTDVKESDLRQCKARIRVAAAEVCRRGQRVLSWDLSQPGPRHNEIPHSFLWVRAAVVKLRDWLYRAGLRLRDN